MKEKWKRPVKQGAFLIGRKYIGAFHTIFTLLGRSDTYFIFVEVSLYRHKDVKE